MGNVGEEEVAHVVGIHKGYDNKGKLNICTLITEEAISRIGEWMVEMGLGPRVSRPEEKKEAVGLQQKMKEKKKDDEIAKLGEEIKQLSKERK